jgi:hypothetical protein
MLTINQSVLTPNGYGVYQGKLYEDGEVLAMVAHKPGTPINLDKVRRAYGVPGRGIWDLVAYPMVEVREK